MTVSIVECHIFQLCTFYLFALFYGTDAKDPFGHKEFLREIGVSESL